MKKLTASEIIELLPKVFVDLSEDLLDDFSASECLPQSSLIYLAQHDLAYAKKQAAKGKWTGDDQAFILMQILDQDLLPQLGTMKVIEITDNYDSSGLNDQITVILFEDHDVYLRFLGYLSSYGEDDSYEDWGKEVKPIQEVVTRYA